MTEDAADKHSMRGNEWRLRLYVLALYVSIALYLAAHGDARAVLIVLSLMAMIAVGTWQPQGPLLPVGVSLGLTVVVLHPVVVSAIEEQRSLAVELGRVQLWPQMLVALFSSRVLSCQQELCFQRFWQDPLADTSSVSMQSVPAAIALGVFLTMLHYTVMPTLSYNAAGGTQSILVSALLGETIIHTLILFLFFIVLAFIAEGVWHYRSDRLTLRRIRRLLSASRDWSLLSIEAHLSRSFPTLSHRRVFRLLTAAAELRADRESAQSHLATLSFDAFHTASRQFIRTLIPFLTLLGFLGTVIGLATAVSELPGNLIPEEGAIDVSASLAGLAVKFETTFLGLVATMLASLLLNVLEKQEHQLAAECLLIVHEKSGARV